MWQCMQVQIFNHPDQRVGELGAKGNDSRDILPGAA